MIIRTNKLTEGTKITEDKGQFTMTQIVNIDPVLAANYHARKDSQNGFSKDHSFRRVLSVPMEVFMMWKREFPELASGDREAENSALKILIEREENSIFKTVDNGIF